jgi:hypothetical protein
MPAEPGTSGWNTRQTPAAGMHAHAGDACSSCAVSGSAVRRCRLSNCSIGVVPDASDQRGAQY